MKTPNFKTEMINFIKKKITTISSSNSPIYSSSGSSRKMAWMNLAETINDSSGNPHDAVVKKLHDLFLKSKNDNSLNSDGRVKATVFHEFLKEFNAPVHPGLNLYIEQRSGENCLDELKGYSGENPKLVIDFCIDYLSSEKEDLSNDRLSTSYADDPSARASETISNNANAERLNEFSNKLNSCKSAYVQGLKRIKSVQDRENSLSNNSESTL